MRQVVTPTTPTTTRSGLSALPLDDRVRRKDEMGDNLLIMQEIADAPMVLARKFGSDRKKYLKYLRGLRFFLAAKYCGGSLVQLADDITAFRLSSGPARVRTIWSNRVGRVGRPAS